MYVCMCVYIKADILGSKSRYYYDHGYIDIGIFHDGIHNYYCNMYEILIRKRLVLTILNRSFFFLNLSLVNC